MLEPEGISDRAGLEGLEATVDGLVKEARLLLDVACQLHLPAEIVIDDPLAPKKAGRIQVVVERAPRRARLVWVGGSRVEGNPAEAVEINLHPTVGVARAHHIVVA